MSFTNVPEAAREAVVELIRQPVLDEIAAAAAAAGEGPDPEVRIVTLYNGLRNDCRTAFGAAWPACPVQKRNEWASAVEALGFMLVAPDYDLYQHPPGSPERAGAEEFIREIQTGLFGRQTIQNAIMALESLALELEDPNDPAWRLTGAPPGYNPP